MPLQSKPAVIAALLWITTGIAAFAQPQTTPPPADPLAAAPRINGEDAKNAIAKGEAVLVDVRAKESYDLEHAKGAISLPLHELPSRMGELPKDKKIITYCT